MSSILFYSTRKSKIFRKKLHSQKNGPIGAPGPASASPWRAKVSQCRKTERVDPLRFSNIHSAARHEKIGEIFFRKKISMPKQTERGEPFGIFQHPFCRKTSKKCRGPFGEKNSEKKCFAVPKKIERGDSLVSPGMVCYAEKQVKPFRSSLLGQMVHFDTIIFCRTFKN